MPNSIRVEHTQTRFTLWWNERVVVRHTPDAPFAEVGKGSLSLGGGQIRDKTPALTPLINVHYVEERNLVRFFGGKFSLSFHLSEKKGCLRLAPSRASAGLNRLRLRFPAESGVAVYGCGAQPESFNHKGKKVPIWIRDPSSFAFKSDKLLLSDCPLPCFTTEDGFFLSCDTGGRVLFDFAQTWHFCSFWELPAAVHCGTASHPAEASAALSRLGGRPPLLPGWIYDGVVLEGRGGSRALADTLAKTLDAGIKISAVYISDWAGRIQTARGSHRFYDWIWNETLYPQLDTLIRKLEDENIRILAYVNPHLSIEGRLFAQAAAAGYLVQKAEGGNYISDMGGFMAGHVDLTNPTAVEWYRGVLLKNILDFGFAGFSAGGGNFLPADAVLFSGENPLRMRNRWTSLWTALCRDVIAQSGRTNTTVFFSETGGAKSGTSAMLLTAGEQHAAWHPKLGLPAALNALLSLSVSGIGLCTADCGGAVSWSGGRSKELLMRWIEFAAFCPVFRLIQGDGGWQFDSDAETTAHFARFARIHHLLAPYIREHAGLCNTEGLPVMRPLPFSFPDSAFKDADNGFLLGRDILIFPVLRKGITKTQITLPNGLWHRLWDGGTIGPGKHVLPCPIGTPPVFVRAETVYGELFEQIRKLQPQ